MVASVKATTTVRLVHSRTCSGLTLALLTYHPALGEDNHAEIRLFWGKVLRPKLLM
jgi:hypothetical protein